MNYRHSLTKTVHCANAWVVLPLPQPAGLWFDRGFEIDTYAFPEWIFRLTNLGKFRPCLPVDYNVQTTQWNTYGTLHRDVCH